MQNLALPFRALSAQSTYTEPSICKETFLFCFFHLLCFCLFLSRNEPFRRGCWCAFLFCITFIKTTSQAIFTVPIFSERCFFYFLHYCTGYWFWELNLVYFQVSQAFHTQLKYPFLSSWTLDIFIPTGLMIHLGHKKQLFFLLHGENLMMKKIPLWKCFFFFYAETLILKPHRCK